MISIPANSSLLRAHNLKIVGNSDQFVVLSHGLGSDQSVWKYVLPYLVNDYKVILYGLMGAGSTNPDDFSFNGHSSLQAYADDLLAILDELEIESCVYVGASIERPEVFKKLDEELWRFTRVHTNAFVFMIPELTAAAQTKVYVCIYVPRSSTCACFLSSMLKFNHHLLNQGTAKSAQMSSLA